MSSCLHTFPRNHFSKYLGKLYFGRFILKDCFGELLLPCGLHAPACQHLALALNLGRAAGCSP